MRERLLEFRISGGREVRASESVKTGEEAPAIGSRVPIHYDRSDPTSVVTDESHTGRNITLWIVAVKLVLGGVVLRVLRGATPTSLTRAGYNASVERQLWECG